MMLNIAVSATSVTSRTWLGLTVSKDASTIPTSNTFVRGTNNQTISNLVFQSLKDIDFSVGSFHGFEK